MYRTGTLISEWKFRMEILMCFGWVWLTATLIQMAWFFEPVQI